MTLSTVPTSGGLRHYVIRVLRQHSSSLPLLEEPRYDAKNCNDHKLKSASLSAWLQYGLLALVAFHQGF